MVPKLEGCDRPSEETIELRSEGLDTFDAAVEKGEGLEVSCWSD
jgi:hypothetical protein